MKKIFLLPLLIFPFLLNAEVVEELFFDQESEEIASLEESEISYAPMKRSSPQDALFDDDEESEAPACKPKPQCKPKPAPPCKPKPVCRAPVACRPVKQCCPDRKKTPEACPGLMFPSAHESMVQDGAGFNFFGEWLYYQVTEAGLVYTANGNTALITSPNVNDLIPVVMEPDYHSGFRVGFDYEMNHDHWKFIAAWTRFHQQSSFSHKLQVLPTDGSFDNLAAYFYYPTAAFSKSLATADWKFHYDLLDVVLGRDCYLGKRVFIKPYAGFRGALVTQRVDAAYYNPLPTGDFYATGRQTFRGAGLKFGADLHWMFAKHFGLYTDISTSLLWGTYKTHLTNSTSLQVPPTLVTPMNTKSIQSIVEMGAGFEVDTYFACDRYHLTLRAGWEESLWIAHNHMFQAVQFSSGSTRNAAYNSAGQLAISGISAGIAIGF